MSRRKKRLHRKCEPERYEDFFARQESYGDDFSSYLLNNMEYCSDCLALDECPMRVLDLNHLALLDECLKFMRCLNQIIFKKTNSDVSS